MFAKTPNISDYIAFLSGVAGIPPADIAQVFPMPSGTATGGDIGSLIDGTQNWKPDQWASGFSVIDETLGQMVEIDSNDPATLFFVTQLTDPVQLGDSYQIIPDIVLTTLDIAREMVNETLQVSPNIYTLAVYNLATDRLINYANDVPGQTFFQDLRKQFRLTDVSVGVPSQASDQGTAVGILNPEQLKLLTIQDLQTMKTPYGRVYMGFAQAYGQTIWGLS